MNKNPYFEYSNMDRIPMDITDVNKFLDNTGFKIIKENLDFSDDLIIRARQNLNAAKYSLNNKDYYAYIENLAASNEKISKAVGLVFGLLSPNKLQEQVGHNPQEVYILICKSNFGAQFETIEKTFNPNMKPLEDRIKEVENLKNNADKIQELDNSIPQLIQLMELGITTAGIGVFWIIPLYLMSFLIAPHYKYVRYPFANKENKVITPPVKYDNSLNIIKYGFELMSYVEKSIDEFETFASSKKNF